MDSLFYFDGECDTIIINGDGTYSVWHDGELYEEVFTSQYEALNFLETLQPVFE